MKPRPVVRIRWWTVNAVSAWTVLVGCVALLIVVAAVLAHEPDRGSDAPWSWADMSVVVLPSLLIVVGLWVVAATGKARRVRRREKAKQAR